MSLRRRTAWALAVLLVLCSAGVRYAAAQRADAPWISPDETLYALLGRALWTSGHLSLLGEDVAFYSLVYPGLIGLPLSVLGPESGLVAVQALQALVMSSVSLVLFVWGRALVGDAWALAAATLGVLVPGLAYSGFLMSETAFYLVVTLALWALWRALTRPTLLRQGALLAALALAVLTRLQALALVPAVVLAIALFAVFQRDAAVLRRFAPAGAALATVVLAGLAAAAIGGDWRRVAGGYAAATEGYDAAAAARDVAAHAGGVYLVVAGIPLVALGVLAYEAVRARSSGGVSALVATALAWTSVTVVQVGVFASEWVGHMAERHLLTVAPPLFLVFVVWVAGGARRPQPATSLAALLAAAAALLVPISRFATQTASLDAFTFIPLWRLGEETSAETLQLVYSLGVAGLALAAVCVPARARLVLVGVVAATLAGASALAAVEIDRLTRRERAWVFSTVDPRWIDAAADARVTYLHAHTLLPSVLWKTVYWNERVDRVLRLGGTPSPTPMRGELVTLREDGTVVPASARRWRGGYLVAPSGLALDGEAVATYGPAADLAGLTLWRARAPLRVRWLVTGAQWNGDIVAGARVEVLGCTRGRLELTLLGKTSTEVELLVDGRRVTSVPMVPERVWTGALPAPADVDGGGRCTFEIRSPGLVGATRIEFVPA